MADSSYPIAITVEDPNDPVEVAQAVLDALVLLTARGGSFSSEVLNGLLSFQGDMNIILEAQG